MGCAGRIAPYVQDRGLLGTASSVLHPAPGFCTLCSHTRGKRHFDIPFLSLSLPESEAYPRPILTSLIHRPDAAILVVRCKDNQPTAPGCAYSYSTSPPGPGGYYTFWKTKLSVLAGTDPDCLVSSPKFCTASCRLQATLIASRQPSWTPADSHVMVPQYSGGHGQRYSEYLISR